MKKCKNGGWKIKTNLEFSIMDLIVVDTNVWISYLIGRKNQFENKIVKLLKSKQIVACISEETLGELKETIAKNKFKGVLNFNKCGQFIAWYQYNCKMFESQEKLDFDRDPKDAKFLLLAKVSKAKFLVTWDLDLLELGSFENIKICTPNQFIDKNYQK